MKPFNVFCSLCLVALVILGVLTVGQAHAGGSVIVHESEGLGRIQVFAGVPCTAPGPVALIAQLGADADDYFKAAVVHEGKSYEGCAAVFPQLGGVCVVVDGLGHVDVSLDKFKKDEGV